MTEPSHFLARGSVFVQTARSNLPALADAELAHCLLSSYRIIDVDVDVDGNAPERHRALPLPPWLRPALDYGPLVPLSVKDYLLGSSARSRTRRLEIK